MRNTILKEVHHYNKKDFLFSCYEYSINKIKDYLPLHIQSIMGYSATIAGISLIGTSIAWFMSSISIAKLMKKYPTNIIVMFSSLILSCVSAISFSNCLFFKFT